MQPPMGKVNSFNINLNMFVKLRQKDFQKHILKNGI